MQIITTPPTKDIYSSDAPKPLIQFLEHANELLEGFKIPHTPKKTEGLVTFTKDACGYETAKHVFQTRSDYDKVVEKIADKLKDKCGFTGNFHIIAACKNKSTWQACCMISDAERGDDVYDISCSGGEITCESSEIPRVQVVDGEITIPEQWALVESSTNPNVIDDDIKSAMIGAAQNTAGCNIRFSNNNNSNVLSINGSQATVSGDIESLTTKSLDTVSSQKLTITDGEYLTVYTDNVTIESSSGNNSSNTITVIPNCTCQIYDDNGRSVSFQYDSTSHSLKCATTYASDVVNILFTNPVKCTKLGVITDNCTNFTTAEIMEISFFDSVESNAAVKICAADKTTKVFVNQQSFVCCGNSVSGEKCLVIDDNSLREFSGYFTMHDNTTAISELYCDEPIDDDFQSTASYGKILPPSYEPTFSDASVTAAASTQNSPEIQITTEILKSSGDQYVFHITKICDENGNEIQEYTPTDDRCGLEFSTTTTTRATDGSTSSLTETHKYRLTYNVKVTYKIDAGGERTITNNSGNISGTDMSMFFGYPYEVLPKSPTQYTLIDFTVPTTPTITELKITDDNSEYTNGTYTFNPSTRNLVFGNSKIEMQENTYDPDKYKQAGITPHRFFKSNQTYSYEKQSIEKTVTQPQFTLPTPISGYYNGIAYYCEDELPCVVKINSESYALSHAVSTNKITGLGVKLNDKTSVYFTAPTSTNTGINIMSYNTEGAMIRVNHTPGTDSSSVKYNSIEYGDYKYVYTNNTEPVYHVPCEYMFIDNDTNVRLHERSYVEKIHEGVSPAYDTYYVYVHGVYIGNSTTPFHIFTVTANEVTEDSTTNGPTDSSPILLDNQGAVEEWFKSFKSSKSSKSSKS